MLKENLFPNILKYSFFTKIKKRIKIGEIFNIFTSNSKALLHYAILNDNGVIIISNILLWHC